MLKSEDIFNNCCIFGNSYSFNEHENNFVDFTKAEFNSIMNEIYKLHDIL